MKRVIRLNVYDEVYYRVGELVDAVVEKEISAPVDRELRKEVRRVIYRSMDDETMLQQRVRLTVWHREHAGARD